MPRETRVFEILQGLEKEILLLEEFPVIEFLLPWLKYGLDGGVISLKEYTFVVFSGVKITVSSEGTETSLEKVEFFANTPSLVFLIKALA